LIAERAADLVVGTTPLALAAPDQESAAVGRYPVAGGTSAMFGRDPAASDPDPFSDEFLRDPYPVH
jgi:hypothetical protein